MSNEKKTTYSECTVDTTKLKENFNKGINTYKYKDLCALINQPCPPAGSSRVNQRKYLSYFFEYHRDGHSYIIDEIYDSPKPELYKSNRSPYYNHSIYIILAEISHELLFSSTAYISKSRLARRLGFVNQDYWKYFFNSEALSQELKIYDSKIRKFYARITNSYKTIIKNTLSKMQKQGLIEYSEVLCGVKDSKGFLPLTESEIADIELITSYVYDQMNEDHPIYKYYLKEQEEGWGDPNPMDQEKKQYKITSLRDIYQYGLDEIFFREKQAMIKAELGISNVCLAYCITVHDTVINLPTDRFENESITHDCIVINQTYAKQKKNDYEEYLYKKLNQIKVDALKQDGEKFVNNDISVNNQLIDRLIKLDSCSEKNI